MKLHKNKVTTRFSTFQLICFGLLITQFSFSQKKDENLGTEVVNVVKPYTPSISDAFKVKETPSLNDDETNKKETINYSIFSFPVASTFAPSKGKAASVEKDAQEKLYNSYATLGLGNYINALGELYITKNIGETDYFGGMLRHFSSQGGIKDLLIDDKFSTTGIDLNYGSKKESFSWDANLGYETKSNFWYGLPPDFTRLFADEEEKNNVVKSINQATNYNTITAGVKLDFGKSIFNDISLNFHNFSDKFKSSENRVLLQPNFKFDAVGTTIKTKFFVDYLSGSFKKDYLEITDIKYGFTNLGISPSIAMQKSGWSFNLGATAVYSMDSEISKSKFFVYPNVNASLNLVENILVFYAGAEGGLQQNTYRDFVSQNQFVSPTLYVSPTDRQYDIFGGLKGKVSNNLSFNIKGSFISEKNKALFVNNTFYEDFATKRYAFGNSFDVTYDDVKTVQFYGELKADFSKDFSIGVNGTFNNYTVNREKEAWNLPTFQLGTSLDVNITPKWYAGANVFFVGDRKDNRQFVTDIAADNIDAIVTLKSYFDANAHLGFKYTDRLTAFLKLNNIANQGYEKWLNYPVQSFQIMLGASYKFDF